MVLYISNLFSITCCMPIVTQAVNVGKIKYLISIPYLILILKLFPLALGTAASIFSLVADFIWQAILHNMCCSHSFTV